MKAKKLKEILNDIPNDVEICIVDIDNNNFDFRIGKHQDKTQTYLDLILPIYISSYFLENSDEQIICGGIN